MPHLEQLANFSFLIFTLLLQLQQAKKHSKERTPTTSDPSTLSLVFTSSFATFPTSLILVTLAPSFGTSKYLSPSKSQNGSFSQPKSCQCPSPTPLASQHMMHSNHDVLQPQTIRNHRFIINAQNLGTNRNSLCFLQIIHLRQDGYLASLQQISRPPLLFLRGRKYC